MLALSADLAAMAEPGGDSLPLEIPPDFKEIRLRQVAFTYPGDDPRHGFRLAPVELTIRRNEVIFITGSNGSGKSTLIKLLTTLYRPSEGTLAIDDTLIGPRTLAGPYRRT